MTQDFNYSDKTILVTGSTGLIGSEAVKFYCAKGAQVVGIDNDNRKSYFGETASTKLNLQALVTIPSYIHYHDDIREAKRMNGIVAAHNPDLILHCASQPSHDWAGQSMGNMRIDFDVNVVGTLNMLQAMHDHSPEAVFVFCSTNKVYGDQPNKRKLIETQTRWELDPKDQYAEHGFDETLTIDHCIHSFFGCSKAAADLYVQEFGKNYGLKTTVLRGGCLTGPAHAGTVLHGFLAYLIKAINEEISYTVCGYKGKQVRDNIHSHDFVTAVDEIFRNPRCGEAYNIGGTRFANISMLEAITQVQELLGKEAQITISDQARTGDHIWWISDMRKFKAHYPTWKHEYDMQRTLKEMCEAVKNE